MTKNKGNYKNEDKNRINKLILSIEILYFINYFFF